MEPLREDETSILNGVLELNPKNVETIMTRMEVCTVAPTRRPVCALMVIQQDVVTLSRDTIDYEMIDTMCVPC